MKEIVLGQVGLGHWGPNLLKNFQALEDCEVKTCCDLDKRVLEKQKIAYPGMKTTQDFSDITSDPEIDAVVVATPAPTHFALARDALLVGKHVFVEKPLALRVSEARELIRIANIMSKKIMVGHLLLYHPAISKLKEIIDSGELGEIYYIYTQRLNLGKVRNTENAMWSLAPHDVSVILYLMQERPCHVFSKGFSFLRPEMEDVVYIFMEFEGGGFGQMHVSWLDPTKTRRLTVVGSKRMAVFNELASHNQLKIFDKGIDWEANFLSPRFGEERVIPIEMEDPLKRECRHFLDCLKKDKVPLTDGQNGLDVLEVLQAAQANLGVQA